MNRNDFSFTSQVFTSKPIFLLLKFALLFQQVATEKDFLEAVNKVIKAYAKFSATPRYMTYNWVELLHGSRCFIFPGVDWVDLCSLYVTKVAFPMKFQIFCFVIFKIIFFLLKICHHKRLLFATTKFLFGWTKVASERGAFLNQCIRTNGFFHLKKLVKNSLYGTISSLCCDDFLLEKL